MVWRDQKAGPMHIVVLMPVRDDWASAAELVLQLDKAVSAGTCAMDVLFVDDGSAEPCRPAEFQSDLTAIRSLRVLRLRRNVGHQRAIAIGLAYLHHDQALAYDAVMVMDADGEDTAQGAWQLISAFATSQGKQAVFAARSRRTESLSFRLFYVSYKILHRLLTGVSVRVGNFSILPFSSLSTLTVMSELWNHYAAAVYRSGLPRATVPIPRGHRIAGASRMNFVSLAAHGISAISVFGDVAGVRILAGSIACSVLAALGIVVVLAIRLFTSRAIPGWATYAAGTLAIILIQLIAIAGSFTFTLLSNRINFGFVPARDYELFVAGTQDVYCRD